MKQVTGVRDTLLPYALFLLGAVVAVPLDRITTGILITPIHEIGHVVAAFATGGYGAWDVQFWNEAVIYGGGLFWTYIAGVLFVVAVATAVPIALLRFNKWPAFAGFLYVSGLIHAITGHDLHDLHALRVNGYTETDTVLNVMTVVMVVVMVGALSFFIAKDLTQKRT